MSFYDNIENITLLNENYREVVYTIPDSFQLVLMSLEPGEEIGMEKHSYTTQFIRIESGFGYAEVDGKLQPLKKGVAIIVPPNTLHNVKNLSYSDKLKLYTIYTPPEHPYGAIEKRKKA